MTRDQAKEYINQQDPDFLPKAKKKGYICPKCGQGSTKGVGIAKDPKSGRYHCFDCGLHTDTLELYGLANGISDFNDRLDAAAAYYGIRLGGEEPQRGSNRQEKRAPAQYQKQDKTEQPEDYTTFYLSANRALDQTDYYRGLSRMTLDHFMCGFVQEWRHPKAPKMKPSPRLIIPTSKWSYLARHASKEDYINYRGEEENKTKVGSVHIFNAEALKQTENPVFVTEAEIDAMSIYDAGGEAVALGSASYKDIFLKLFEDGGKYPPLIISLDNDKAGESAAPYIEEKLTELGVSCYRYNIAGEYKDANERLEKDPASLVEAVQATLEEVKEKELERMDELGREYRAKNAASSYLQDFLNGIVESASTPEIPTGFPSLDKLLDGGLYAGLYTIGAISSLGKTTLALQIADNIASSGKDVLIVSLEMARTELMAKSISRRTIQEVLQTGGSTRNAKTTRGILNGKQYANYSQAERQLIKTATEEYGEYADHLFILEGVGDVGTKEIRDNVKKHREATGNTPVIVIDYLQILAPADPRASDKQNTDKAVLELKRISRDFKTPVIGISSFNRDNYLEPVNLASFKESGAIEYSADVLIGMQYDGMDYQAGEADASRKKRIRDLLNEQTEKAKDGKPQAIQVKVLKNRNGTRGEAWLDFYPMFNYFAESAGSRESTGRGKKL